MREILFRGKRIDNGEWVEGSLAVIANARINNGKHYILSTASDFSVSFGDGGNRIRIGCWREVDPATVGQYTGINDWNGKRIFEGDVVKGLFYHERSILAVVAFKDGAFGLEWNRGNVKEFSAFTSICNVEYEVVGNIADDPELMGGASE